VALTKSERVQIRRVVAFFKEESDKFELLAENVHRLLTRDRLLRGLVHSSKYRIKDPKHLAEKIERKMVDTRARGKQYSITERNLFQTVEDLAGVRLLHLHTAQMKEMHPLIEALEEQGFRIVGPPVANTWDDEYRRFFREIGIRTRARDSMYTSVHYIVEESSKTKRRCELQVRTLMEEVFGEVSHAINYPDEARSVACKEQIKTLARVASGSTRLVDSIFTSYAAFEKEAK
jgi:putative GTP pyrophosphokinase